MITTCTNCQARYQLENAKIPSRVIQVRCPGCQSVFALDGRMAGTDDIPEQPMMSFDPPASVEKAPVETAPVESAPVESAKPAAPAASVEPSPVAPVTAESTPASAAVGLAILDEPAPDTGSGRRRRCKEEMMARALVSDILVYNRETRDAGLKEGNLLEALGGEIKKSWELYKEKVTPEVANSSTYFREALNEILADGEQVF